MSQSDHLILSKSRSPVESTCIRIDRQRRKCGQGQRSLDTLIKTRYMLLRWLNVNIRNRASYSHHHLLEKPKSHPILIPSPAPLTKIPSVTIINIIVTYKKRNPLVNSIVR